MGRRISCLFACLVLVGGTADSVAAAAQRSRTKAVLAYVEGLKAFHNGEYREALNGFEEALRHEPRNGESWFWLGLTYLKLGQADDAVTAFRRSLSERRTLEIDATQVRDHLKAAERLAAGEPAEVPVAPEDLIWQPRRWSPRWASRLSFFLANDSNVAALPEDLTLILAPGEVVEGPQDDTLASVELQAEFYPFYDRGAHTMEIGLEARQSVHQDFTGLDPTEVRGIVQWARGADPRGYLAGPLGLLRVPQTKGKSRPALLLQGAFAQLALDGTTYFRASQAAATMVLHPGSRTAAQIDVLYQDRDFPLDTTSDLRLSGTEISVRAGPSFFFDSRLRQLRLGLRAGERSAGRAFESSLFEASADLSLALGPSFSFYLGATARRDDFHHDESNLFVPGGPRRRDTTWRAIAAWTWVLRPRLHLILRISHTERDSNLGRNDYRALDYRKTTTALGWSWFP